SAALHERGPDSRQHGRDHDGCARPEGHYAHSRGHGRVPQDRGNAGGLDARHHCPDRHVRRRDAGPHRVSEEQGQVRPSVKQTAVRFENSVALVAMAGIIVLPLAEIVLRKWFATGINGATPFAQHLTMWVGMLGAAIAARDGKLLSLATGEFLEHSAVARVAKFIAALIGSAVSTLFAVGGVNLVKIDRLEGTEIAAGVPVWVADLALPFGFALIALRLVWNASTNWTLRAAALIGPVAGYWLATHPEVLDGQPALPWLGVIIVAAILGAPIFVLLGGCAAVLFMVQGSKPTVLMITAYQELTGSAGLATIPLFTLAGY